MTIGIGSGDRVSKPENEAVGLPYLSGADRHEQLASVIEVLAAAREGPVSVDRPHVSVDLPPAPRGDFSIWVGGTADAVVTTAARWADAFNIWGSPPEQVAAKRRLLDGMSAERAVGLTWGGQVITAHSDAEARSQAGERDPRWFLIGSPTTLARRLAEVTDAGVDELVLATPFATRRDSYDLLAEVRDELTHLS
jgi:alkanesulfonate monooxygenase SsuD/methylene tetrahydromethanopterin reductase-like flavin-dependent oxidoreductase (luciferase family)